MITIKITIYPSPLFTLHSFLFPGTPVGFDVVDDRQPSVRYATLGFGVQRRWRIKNKIGASGAH